MLCMDALWNVWWQQWPLKMYKSCKAYQRPETSNPCWIFLNWGTILLKFFFEGQSWTWWASSWTQRSWHQLWGILTKTGKSKNVLKEKFLKKNEIFWAALLRAGNSRPDISQILTLNKPVFKKYGPRGGCSPYTTRCYLITFQQVWSAWVWWVCDPECQVNMPFSTFIAWKWSLPKYTYTQLFQKVP